MSPKSENTGAMVAVGSPEFKDAIADAVARALAARPILSDVDTLPRPQTVAATSIDTTQPGLDDLTVRFTKFCTFQGHGYQRGQEAGFPRKAAEALHQSGSAFIVQDPRRDR